MTTTDLSEGSARLVLLIGVTLLHPEDAVFDAMLEGWTTCPRPWTATSVRSTPRR